MTLWPERFKDFMMTIPKDFVLSVTIGDGKVDKNCSKLRDVIYERDQKYSSITLTNNN